YKPRLAHPSPDIPTILENFRIAGLGALTKDLQLALENIGMQLDDVAVIPLCLVKLCFRFGRRRQVGCLVNILVDASLQLRNASIRLRFCNLWIVYFDDRHKGEVIWVESWRGKLCVSARSSLGLTLTLDVVVPGGNKPLSNFLFSERYEQLAHTVSRTDEGGRCPGGSMSHRMV